VFIECVAGPKGRLVQNFVGHSSGEPAWQEGQSGLEIVIIASATSVGLDAPVYYRGMRVGKVERKALSSDGRSVRLLVSINQPYARLIRENTKFWDASGLKASLGFLFIKVPTETLESLVRGGLAFATPDNRDMGAPVKPGHEFKLNKVSRREWLRWTPSLSLTKE
jgi:paraquat-inducible protein B